MVKRMVATLAGGRALRIEWAPDENNERSEWAPDKNNDSDENKATE